MSRVDLNTIVHGYTGGLDELQSALGFWHLGHAFGWRLMRLWLTNRTFKRYSSILGIDARDVFPEVGPLATHAQAWPHIRDASNFWKLVSGDVKLPLSRAERRRIVSGGASVEQLAARKPRAGQ